MPEAKDGEVTIVEVESMGFNKTKVERMMMLKKLLDLNRKNWLSC